MKSDAGWRHRRCLTRTGCPSEGSGEPCPVWHRNSNRSVILYAPSLGDEELRAFSNCSTPSASRRRVQPENEDASRMQAPRNSAMYCNSSIERPERNRRDFLRLGSSTAPQRALRRMAFIGMDGGTGWNPLYTVAVLCRKNGKAASAGHGPTGRACRGEMRAFLQWEFPYVLRFAKNWDRVRTRDPERRPSPRHRCGTCPPLPWG